jgi:hypothetical protein
MKRETMRLNVAAGPRPRRGEQFNTYDGSFKVSRLFRNRAKRLTYQNPRSL